MKKIIYLNFVLAFGLYAQTNNAIATDAKSTEQTIKEEATIAPPINKPVESKTAEAKPVDPKPDFTLIQFFANDVNFRGTSIYGEKLSRRNQEGYKSFNDAWLVSSNIIFHLPIPGLKFLFTSNNPIENRSNKDADQRFQTSPGADDQTAKLNQAIQTGSFSFDPSAVRSRKEQNGLRDVFIGQMYYDWETKAGGFRTGFFFLNNQNYPAKFNLGEWVFGFRPDVLKFLNPELTMFYRFTSELNGLNNGNIHIRAIIKHEFFKEEFFRVTPILEAGYQAANNNTDRRNGVSDITARLQFFFGKFFIGLNGIYRPDLYLYDNDRVYPKTGVYGDTNSNDGMTVDPSKTTGVKNQTVLNEIAKTPGRGASEYLTRSYQEQHIVRNIFIVNIGYTLRF